MLQLVLSYSSIRLILYIIIAVLFSQFFVRVLMKRKAAIRVAGVLMLAACMLATALLPVENLFFRHSTPEASVHYSFPNEGIVKIAEHRNWAAIQLDDDKTAFISRDDKGWKTVPPNIIRENIKSGHFHNIYYMTKKLDAGLYYVGLRYTLSVNPAYNADRIKIETLTDSRGSQFQTYERDLFDNEILYGHEAYFFTFTDTGGKGYKLIISGEEVTIQ